MLQTLHEIEFELSDDLAAEYARAVIGRDQLGGWSRQLASGLLVVLAGAAIVLLGLQGWIAPGLASVLLLVLAIPVGLSLVRRRWAQRLAEWSTLLPFRGADRTVRVRFSEDRVHMETSVADGGGAWSELHELVAFPRFRVLRFVSGAEIVLPQTAITPELDTFLRRKAEEVRALIRQD